MCRLFGWAGDTAVSAASALGADLDRLVELSRVHDDGWGVAWVDAGGTVHRVRHENAAHEAADFTTVMNEAVGRAGIVHLRYATDGIVCSLDNSHPFISDRTLFAHNGSVERGPGLDALIDGDLLEAVRGDTDSERYFLALVSAARRTGSYEKAFTEVVSALPEPEWSSLNAMLVDGTTLYVLSRHHPERRPEWAGPDYYDLWYDSDGGLTTVWSEGVREGAGRPLPDGHLLSADGASGRIDIQPV